MAKRRGNPNWGKPEPIGPVTPTITEFEQVVHEYKLNGHAATRIPSTSPSPCWKLGVLKSNLPCNRRELDFWRVAASDPFLFCGIFEGARLQPRHPDATKTRLYTP